MYWAIFGIFHSIFRAAYAEVNRIFDVDNWQMSFMQSVAAVILLVPFIPFMSFPTDLNFYLAALLVALIIAVGVVIQLNMTAIQKGRTSSVAIPIEALAAFIMWIVITPYAYAHYIDNPLVTACVVGSFSITAAALYYVRNTDLSWESLAVVAPVGITFAVAAVVTKLVIPTDPDQVIAACLAFVLVNYTVMSLVLGVFLLLKKKTGPEMLKPPMLKASALTGVCAMLAYTSFVLSVVYAPNPGYTSILAALVPVWLMWYHEIRFIPDKANPMAGFMIAAAIALLLVATWG